MFTLYCTLYFSSKWYVRKNHHKKHLDVWTGTSWHFQINILRLPRYLDAKTGKREGRSKRKGSIISIFLKCAQQNKEKLVVGTETAPIPKQLGNSPCYNCSINYLWQQRSLTSTLVWQTMLGSLQRTEMSTVASRRPSGEPNNKKGDEWYRFYIWAILFFDIILFTKVY